MFDSQSVDTTVSNIGHGSTILSAVVTLLSWLASSQAGVLYGAIGIAVGIAVNVHFKRRQDAREQREHEARMKRINTEPAEL